MAALTNNGIGGSVQMWVQTTFLGDRDWTPPPSLQDGENQPEQETSHQGEIREMSTVGRNCQLISWGDNWLIISNRIRNLKLRNIRPGWLSLGKGNTLLLYLGRARRCNILLVKFQFLMNFVLGKRIRSVLQIYQITICKALWLLSQIILTVPWVTVMNSIYKIFTMTHGCRDVNLIVVSYELNIW